MTTETTKIDFYILPSAATSARLDFACKLTEKAWRLGHRVYLHCSDAAQRQDLDERLQAKSSRADVAALGRI